MSPTVDPRKRLADRGRLLVALLRRGQSEHRRRILLWGGLKILAGIVLGALVLGIVAGLAPELPRPLGILLPLAAWSGLAVLVWKHWVRPLRAVPNLAVFSRLVEERRDFRDMLRAALEFSQRGAPEGESIDLAAATVDRAYDEAAALNLTRLFQFPDRRRDASIAVAAAVALVLLAVLVPQSPGRLARGLAFAWPVPGEAQYGEFEVVTGDVTVLAGEDVEVVGRDHGVLAPEVVLRFNDTGDLWKSRLLQPTTAGAPRDYAFRFEDVRDNLSYRFESGRRRTAEHRITVVNRPIVSRLQLRLALPAYTGRPATLLEEGRGDAVALLGTRVEIDASASSGLGSAVAVPEGEPMGAVTLSGPLPLATQGRAFHGAFVLRGDLRYHFELVDSLGHTNADPVTYQLSAVEDRAPYVEVRQPGGDADLPKSMQVPMQVYAGDDFGITRLTLVYRREKDSEDLDLPWSKRALQLRGAGSTDADGRPLGSGPAPEIVHSFTWTLDDLGLFPGDFVTYYVEAEDNDDFSGHKTARSPTYRLRLQTLSELYAQVQKEDEKRMSTLDEVLDKGKQLQEKYEKLARELKKNPEMDWKKEKEIQGALEKQKQLADEVEKIAEDLQKEVQKLQEQQLVSSEIAQKMDEIRKLMQEVESDTLREYMQRLQEAMKQISPEEIQRAMEQMELSQEEFLKRLERTKSLLEQLRREQRLDSLIERVSELLQNQEKVSENTDQLDPKAGEPQEQKKAEQLAQEQDQLAEKTGELQKELDELAKESAQAGQPQLQDASQQMQQQNPSGEMQEASKGLQQQMMDQAQEHQEKAESSLRSLYQQLMDAQQAMSMSAQMEAAQKLSKAARQALDVSFRQEGLSKQVARAGDLEQSAGTARDQQSLLAATGRIVDELDELAQKSLSAPPQVSQMLGEAMSKMREGSRAYEKGNTLAGRVQGEEAYGLLNRAVVELSRSSQSACSSPSAGQSSGQRMEQLMGQQQQLNQMTQRLQQMLQNPHGMSPEERAQMGRLLGEQRSIEQQLQDIERQAREERELLGRLDKMQEEMREVVDDMESEQIDEQTLRTQERIVSRMLDARRSLHKRDFNEERESRTAADIQSRGGKPLQENDRMKKLRRDIERALRAGTPEEYEELVRQYFRAISEADRQGPQPEQVVP